MRREHWARVYADKQPCDVSWYQGDPTLSLRLIRAAGIARGAPILDVGAGASFLVDRLLAEGYTKPAVLDISGIALDHVRSRLATGANRIEFFEADITEFVPPHTFALWHDRAVFHFLTDAEDRRRYVNVLLQALESGGHLILAAFGIGGPMRCSGLDVVQYDVEKLLLELGSEFELIEEADEDHLTPTGKVQKFAYFRLLRKSG